VVNPTAPAAELPLVQPTELTDLGSASSTIVDAESEWRATRSGRRCHVGSAAVAGARVLHLASVGLVADTVKEWNLGAMGPLIDDDKRTAAATLANVRHHGQPAQSSSRHYTQQRTNSGNNSAYKFVVF